MLQRGGTFQRIVTLVLALALSICCCNLHGATPDLGSPYGCSADPSVWMARHGGAEQVIGDVQDGLGSELNADQNDDENSGGGCTCSAMSGHAAATPFAVDHHSDQSRPGRHGGHHDCRCGQHNAKVLTLKAQAGELPAPPVVGALTWPAALSDLRQFRVCISTRVGRLIPQPPHSLLDQHCALKI